MSVTPDDDTGGGPAGAAGTSAAFEAVYREERLGVTRLAFLLVRSRPVAEEVAQEAFLRLFERFATVTNPPGFLRTVVVRLAIGLARRNEVERRRLPLVGAGHDPHVHVDPVGGDEDGTWAALGRLRPERRAVLVLRFYEDLSHERIAELLGCSAGTIRSRARRALADLRKELDDAD